MVCVLGLFNGLQTLKGLAGLYSVLPAISIDDDADTEKRMVKLDVTKTLFPVDVMKKFLRLMGMYKMNELVLVLGSDDSVRFALDDNTDFQELRLVSHFC